MRLGFFRAVGYGLLLIISFSVIFQITVYKRWKTRDVVSFRSADISSGRKTWRQFNKKQRDQYDQSLNRGRERPAADAAVIQEDNGTLYFTSDAVENSTVTLGTDFGDYGRNQISYQDFVNKPSVDLTQLRANWRADARIIQNASNRRRFLTIGIPTVKREKDEYIINTVQSIVNCTTEQELSEIYIVVFLADFDAKWKEDITQRLRERFDKIISQGTLHVIHAWESFYPPLDNLKHTFVDPESKKKWRAKQNVDYAFLFLYSEVLAQYYIQMEDDIYTIPGYLQAIKDYIHKFRERWVCLEFSELGFIGKLYHSEDIIKLAKMVLLFYAQQPCDVTYLNFNVQMLQFKRHIRRPTIFEHVGYHSSLPGKIQPLKDRFFHSYPKTIKGDNPAGSVYTSMPFEAYFNPDNCYSNKNGIFWSTRQGKANDWLTIVFNEPQLLDRIEIETGTHTHPDDKIHYAKLEVSLASKAHWPGKPDCGSNKLLGYFDDGSIKVNNVQSVIGTKKIHCLSVILTNKQENWVIVKEIAVFVARNRSSERVS